MKHLKMSIYLLLTAAIFTSCEKETEGPIDANSSKNPESIQNISSISIDAGEFQEKSGKQGSKIGAQAKSEIITYEHFSENGILEFHENSQSFLSSCNPIMQIEDFQNADVPPYNGRGWHPANLDEFTDHYVNYDPYSFISPGDIQSNIKFSIDYEDNEWGYIWVFNTWSFTGAYGNKVLVSYNSQAAIADEIVIEFTKNNNYSVSFELFPSNSSDNITIEVYGTSGLLGYSTVIDAYQGNFWGTHSKESIKKIIIKTINSNKLAIDNVNFGYCDSDNDGYPNAVDSHPYSNLSEKINIGGCNTNAKNVFVKGGTTMMDQVDDLINQINSEYNGQNYKTLHSKFMTKLAQITYNWRTAKLITTTQRSQISNCAWGSNIPYYNNDN